ncbi:class I SAM-dependent methyltransferase [Amnibacterium endophyticum]|uniref:Class I SAM-dependent methyltransferase n=1 Tax=Amnibacterium endophyticum TaxID=2109337 RepID=A0ABW4LCV3_9MICO
MTDRRAEALAGRGFGEAAEAYVSGRPDYPADAVAWLVGEARRVVDVGAGTGKLTAGLLAARREVTAVEPDAGMLAALRREVPDAVALRGSAEALPLPDSSAEAVVYGQAWHWVDVERASAEAARVLVPGGVLGLVWNVRDSRVDWVRELGDIMRGSAAEEAIEQDAVRVGAPFGPLERFTQGWSRPMGVEQVVAMAASRSYVIALPVPQREALLERIRTLLADHPDTRGRSRIDLPYRTTAFRTRRP